MTKLHFVGPRSGATEPIWEAEVAESRYNIEMLRGFNWHNSYASKSDCHKYIEQWISQRRVDLKKHLPAWKKVREHNIIPTYPIMARMQLQGFPLSKDHEMRIVMSVIHTLALSLDDAERMTPRVSVQDRMREQLGPFLAKIKSIARGTESADDFIGIISLETECKAPHYKLLRKEIDGYIEKSGKNADELVRAREIVVKRIEQQTATRIVRRKPMDKKKAVKKLKYLERCPNLSIPSISPTEILGATKVWVFDTKNRRLHKFISEFPSGLYVTGTTICGLGEASRSKIIRSPETTLKDLVRSRSWDKHFEAVTTKETVPVGRMNAACLLLKAEK